MIISGITNKWEKLINFKKVPTVQWKLLEIRTFAADSEFLSPFFFSGSLLEKWYFFFNSNFKNVRNPSFFFSNNAFCTATYLFGVRQYFIPREDEIYIYIYIYLDYIYRIGPIQWRIRVRSKLHRIRHTDRGTQAVTNNDGTVTSILNKSLP